MKGNFVGLSVFLCKLSRTQIAAQTRRALPIGTNTNQPEGIQPQRPIGCAYGRCELDRLSGDCH